MTWHTTLEGLWTQAWQELSRGVADRRHPARTPTLATISPEGPAMRTVVLRGARAEKAQLECHTDSASAKVAEIQADPRVGLHVWIPKRDLQLRLSGTAELIHGDKARWDAVPETAQMVYGGTPAPGTPMHAPEDHKPGATLDRFTVILCTLSRVELLHLGPGQHRRAVFDGPDWTGAWCAP